MKSKDIEVGRLYVYGKSLHPDTDTDCSRVLILAKNHPDPRGATRWNYKTQRDEAVVYALWGRIFHAYNGYKDPDRDQPIAAQMVIEPWEDYEARQQAERRCVSDRADTMERVRAARCSTAQATVDRINEVLGTSMRVTTFPLDEHEWIVQVIVSEADARLLGDAVEGMNADLAARTQHDEALTVETEGMPR